MKRRSMSSPTPSVDSLSGAPNMGAFVDQGDLGLGLELPNGCHGSSSSSSCSSIIFPHLSIHSNGTLINGGFHCNSSGSHHSNSNGDLHGGGLPSPTGVNGNGSNISSIKCGLCQDAYITRPKVLPCLHTFCQDCLEKSQEVGDRLLCPTCRQDCSIGSQFRRKSMDLHDVVKTFETAATRLQTQYMKAQSEVTEAFSFYRSLLDERKTELMKELDTLYSSRQVTLSVVTQRVQETLDRMYQTAEFGDRRHASPPQILVLLAMAAAASDDLEFVANYSAMQAAVRNTSGYIRSAPGTEAISTISTGKQPPAPIARPAPTQNQVNGYGNQNGVGSLSTTTLTNGHNGLESSLLSKRLASNQGTPTPYNHMDLGGLSTYEKWSNASDSYQNGHTKEYPSNGVNDFLSSPTSLHGNDALLELTSKLMAPIFPKGPAIKRQKMIYHCKFGEFGTAEAQFTEPSGVAVNANNEIIVADTNNHRIQIFDREGRFKFQFGECGKRDGQLLYPNRVAVVKPSGDIVVTERSPTHQIQIYNQYGQFVRKFGANILQHPRGVTVDNKGRVIVVECKVMRVIIFDQMGTVLHKFGCSKHLEFPNGVVVNDRQEIFISDNRAHCVKVFNYEGVFLRQIGGEGITNYPIGVGINSNGEILVADNHNNFNLTIFTQDGQLVSALESKVKHAQCFDVALMDDGSVVLASKDYRLYIYRYIQVPPTGL